MSEAILHNNYKSINELIPHLNELSEGKIVILNMPIMDCRITLKSLNIIEIAFCEKHNNQYISDHSMRVKINHRVKTIEPQSIWFRCGGTTKSTNKAIQKVLNKTLQDWLQRTMQQSFNHKTNQGVYYAY